MQPSVAASDVRKPWLPKPPPRLHKPPRNPIPPSNPTGKPLHRPHKPLNLRAMLRSALQNVPLRPLQPLHPKTRPDRARTHKWAARSLHTPEETKVFRPLPRPRDKSIAQEVANQIKALTEAKRTVEPERDSAMAGREPGSGGKRQDHPAVAGCIENEPGYSEHPRGYSLQDKAADIKSTMQSYGETVEQQKAVGAWLCDYCGTPTAL